MGHFYNRTKVDNMKEVEQKYNNNYGKKTRF